MPDKSKMTVTDKWLVIRTNEFIKKATAQMDDFKAYNVIKDFEVFVDDISNWYIRSNRRRFWKTGDEDDKMLAYWVLFHAINACTKIMAPIIPFMTEEIWQKLTRRVLPQSELSVHLSDWPAVLEGFEDDGVLQQTADARDIIAVALKLRNEHQIKVRQPLSKLYLSCSDDEMAKIAVFEKNILDELNIKEMVHVSDPAVLEDSYLALNFRAAGAVLKQNVNKMKQALEAASADEMAACVAAFKAGEAVKVSGFDDAYDPAIFNLMTKTKAGIVSAECQSGTVVALDVVLTDDLIQEGLVRDTVRQCQLVRKEAGYEVEQRVVLAVETANEALLAALRESKAHMCAELLADEIVFGALADADLVKPVSIADTDVTLAVKKA
ncbi:MAG: class I tRNA ligase family protein [Clostridia bacterium]|nr:class I tRNA ligase family protein [Clostridia bacterium]